MCRAARYGVARIVELRKSKAALAFSKFDIGHSQIKPLN
jgi:hypothetical protein